MTEATDIVERLHFLCTDWDGRRMGPGELVMDGLLCGELLDAATEIERLRRELEEARERNLLAHYRADNAVADLEKARDALAPFAACCFADNGDVTINSARLCSGDFLRAAMLTALLAELDGKESEGR